MKPLLYYILQVILISGMLYGYYHFFLRNKKFHRYNRFYLLASAGLSILIPFLHIPVYFNPTDTNAQILFETLGVTTSPGIGETGVTISHDLSRAAAFDWQPVILVFYLLIAFIALTRILFSLIRIRKIINNHQVENLDRIHFVNTEEPGTPFSFFRWLFWNKQIPLQSEKGEQIFRHELFHIEQKHSRDVLATELLTVFFWINPFFHLVKRELRTIHEFLADQFAVSENKKWEYAELLLMQALQTKHSLVHPFFHNQIKRRIAMITNSKKPSYQYLRKLMVLPIAALLLAVFAFSYRNKKEQPAGIDKTFNVVIDVGHGGTDPGARANDGTLEKEIVLAIAQKIKALNDDDNIRIIFTREADKTLDLKLRSAFSNEQKADLLLSLHINSSPDASKNGIEVYIPKKSHPYYSENRILASILLNYSGLYYPVVHSAKQSEKSILVIDNSNCPSALIEFGYISNEKDLAFMKDPSSQEKFARTILQTIDQYATQQQSSDWNERKNVFTDTIPPVITFTKNVSTGKYEGTYDGRKIKSVWEYKPGGQLIFIFENKDLVMLSEALTKELREKYGTILSSQIISKGEIKTDARNDVNNKIFAKVEVEPAFPGGDAKWKQFQEAQLNQSIPTQKGAPEGHYTVIVQFVVRTDGSITDLRTLTKHGYGMEEEAIRLVSKGPKWIPALQNGKQVHAYKKQKVDFFVKSVSKTNTPETKDYSDPATWDLSDPEYRLWRQKAIKEVIALAREQGEAAYIYKGRTYVFGKIANPDPNVNTFTEQDGIYHVFLLNGELVNSIDEINKYYDRSDIKKLNLLFRKEALERFNIDQAIVSIETYDNLITRNK